MAALGRSACPSSSPFLETHCKKNDLLEKKRIHKVDENTRKRMMMMVMMRTVSKKSASQDVIESALRGIWKPLARA